MDPARFLLILALACAGCEEPVDLMDVDGQGRSPDSVAEFYAAETVWHVDILLPAESYETLLQFPRYYVSGDVRIGDTIVENVGIRLKGAFSFQGLGGKSSFKVKFNEFEDGQRFLGLEKLTLNNMRQDPSQVHEWLAYQIFSAAGVPGPRSGFARVTVNGELYGLYANVETMDQRFLDDRFENGNGNLYEAPWGADLDEESVDLFEQDEGEDESRADLDALVLAVSAEGDSVFFGEDTTLDTEEFLRFVAAEAISGHWDGYWKSNNYFLYHEAPVSGPNQGLWSFMPWGLDQSFGQALDPFTSRGVLAEKCFSIPTCTAEYARIGLLVVEAMEGLALERSLQDAVNRISAHVDADPRSPHPPAKAARYQEIVKARLGNVADIMRDRFSCIEIGAEADRDGDGFGACFDDCNDAEAADRPGGIEVCDGRDNDCDGQIDEVLCPCDEKEIGGTTFLFCDSAIAWTSARDECGERGGRLAIFDSLMASEAAFAHARQLGEERSWYVGASDRDEEGSWTDVTGETIDLELFAEGEPDDFGGEHCAALASYAGGYWEDVRCGTLLPYICEVLP